MEVPTIELHQQGNRLNSLDQSDSFPQFKLADGRKLKRRQNTAVTYLVVILFPEVNVKKRRNKVETDDLAESSVFFLFYAQIRPRDSVHCLEHINHGTKLVLQTMRTIRAQTRRSAHSQTASELILTRQRGDTLIHQTIVRLRSTIS